jgi:hypothetical protein
MVRYINKAVEAVEALKAVRSDLLFLIIIYFLHGTGA